MNAWYGHCRVLFVMSVLPNVTALCMFVSLDMPTPAICFSMIPSHTTCRTLWVSKLFSVTFLALILKSDSFQVIIICQDSHILNNSSTPVNILNITTNKQLNRSDSVYFDCVRYSGNYFFAMRFKFQIKLN